MVERDATVSPRASGRRIVPRRGASAPTGGRQEPRPTAGAQPAADASPPPEKRPPTQTQAPAGAPADGPAGPLPPRGHLVHPHLPPGLPTEESLATHDAATNDLRRDIDELRQLLDVDLPAARPVRKRRGRKAMLAVVSVAAAAALATVAATQVRWDDPAGAGRPGPAPSAGATAKPDAADSRAQPPAPAPVVLGRLPASGPGVDTPGTVLLVRPRGPGALDVVEQALLPEPASEPLALQLQDVTRLGGQLATLRPKVRLLRASLDGEPVAARAAGPGRWSVPVRGEPRRVVLSYRLVGSMLDSRPAAAGRALALVTPLLGGRLSGEGLPLTVRTIGPAVRGVSCPGAPDALVLCGTPRGTTWTASVPPSRDPAVVLQLDLRAR